jgi:hypothetical protein
MNKKGVEQLAEEISFRLLATIKHSDHEWLINKLDKTINQTEDDSKPMGGSDDGLPPSDYL